ncbi:MAG: XRE family transcriptional regulator [Proteobacteria bacterium]|nr:MAG: XRE family transcriptional regulator [Pseudomonadota bacterium]
MAKTPAALARERIGLSIEAAAKKNHLSVRTLRDYEAGRGKNLYRARKIARSYGCSVFACFTEQGIANQIAVK